MSSSGSPGNLMSLGAIDFGLDRRRLGGPGRERRPGAPRAPSATPGRTVEKVRAAAHEVARPVVFAVGIIIHRSTCRFWRCAGSRGRCSGRWRLTVVFALAASLVAALTLMPVLASVLPRARSPRRSRASSAGAEADLRTASRWRFGAPQLTVGVAVLVFRRQPWRSPRSWERSSSRASTRARSRCRSGGCRRSRSSSRTASRSKVEKVLREEFAQEIDDVVSRTGRAEIATDPMGVEISDTYIMLNPPEKWRFRQQGGARRGDRERLSRSEGAGRHLQLLAADRAAGLRADLRRALGRRHPALRRRPGDAQEEGRRDRRGLSRRCRARPTSRRSRRPACRCSACASTGRPPRGYGVNAEDDPRRGRGDRGASLSAWSSRGRSGSCSRCASERETRASLERIRDLRVPAPPAVAGGPRRLVPLSQVADVTLEDGPAQISRERISRRINVELERARAGPRVVRRRRPARRRRRGRAADRLDRRVGRPVREPPSRPRRRLAVLLPLALLIIFLLLYTTFGSARLGTLIFLNVPIAATRWRRRARAARLSVLDLGGRRLHRPLRRRDDERRRSRLARREAPRRGA